MSMNLRIAIDGGAATGKSSVAKNVAQELGLNHINTGAMYRLFTKIGLETNLVDNEQALTDEVKKYEYWYENGSIQTNAEVDYSNLETTEIAKNVSKVAAYKLIRDFAGEIQIKLAKEPGSLLEGRDIGTIIMPDADVKIFLIVSPDEAAKRRMPAYKKANPNITHEEVVKQIIARNEFDTNRKIAPLKKADDAFEVDTSSLTEKEVIEKVINIIKENV